MNARVWNCHLEHIAAIENSTMAAGQRTIPRSRYREINSHRRFNSSFVTRAGSREREMLFVPEARDAEITSASRPLSHTGYTKWHDFPGAVLVIHRGRREVEREREREKRETHFPTYVCRTATSLRRTWPRSYPESSTATAVS